jgi:uncharacterized membrane protein
LDNKQGAPLGVLLLERFFAQHWGSSKYVLRLLPLLAGIVSLFLFHAVAKRAVCPAAVPIALGLFAIAPALIHYSSEATQSPTTWGNLRIAVLGLIGTVAIWFSPSAMFVLAGIGAVFFVVLIAERQWKQLARFVVA